MKKCRFTKQGYYTRKYASPLPENTDPLLDCLKIIIHRAASHVRSMNVLIRLCQVAAEHLEIRMSHQLLQSKDVHSIAKHDQSERAPKIMGRWNAL